jgi:hypothetical protein
MLQLNWKVIMKIKYTLSMILALIVIIFNELAAKDSFSCFDQSVSTGSIGFIENKGQINSDLKIKYYYQTPNSMVCFTSEGVDYYFMEAIAENNISNMDDQSIEYKMSKTIMRMLNSNARPEITSTEPLDYYMNFYYPYCPDGVINVKIFKKITYKNIYDGIDLVFYHTEKYNSLKYDLVVHPGADPSAIRIAYDMADGISLTSDNSINITNKISTITEERPYVYQLKDKGDNRHEKIDCNFTLEDDIIKFDIADYDRTKALIIDPNVNWSTFWGGLGADHAERIVMDNEDNFFVTGNTLSKNLFVSEDAYQDRNNGLFDAYLTKFDSNGNPLWSTYYGGDQAEYCKGLAVDRLGNVIISGWTWSTNFPTSEDCYQPVYGGNQNDGFIVKFDKTGERQWGTYFGGGGDEHIYAVGTTSWDEIAITGWTLSKNLITSNDAFSEAKIWGRRCFCIHV